MIKKSFLLFFLFLLQFRCGIYAQIPTSCFEIQSILVDACGNPEGENEMVRFIIGPSALNTSNLTINWPNNPYKGICQDAGTASIVATLNASVQGCGLILEPTGGVLPAGATVLLVTSTNMNPGFNSFAGLTDTIYMIFQCSGNTSGHFRNYSSTPAVRTLDMTFTGSCSDQVSYDASELVDQFGVPTTADGSTVDYDFAGNATYTNPGCQAPVSNNRIVLSASDDTVCAGDQITVNANIISGNFSSYFWAGGAGSYSNPSQLNTPYQTNAGFVGDDILRFGAVGNCNDTIYTYLQVHVNSGSVSTISAGGPVTFCAGDSVLLTASQASAYAWSTGETTRSITVYTSNTYTVSVTGSCGTSTASQTVTVDPLPSAAITAGGPLIFCQGGSVTLNGSGNGTYSWSDGTSGSSITVSTSNTYTLSVSNGCGTDTASVIVTSLAQPAAQIGGAPAVLCPGESATLTASGGDTYLWSGGETVSTINITSGGVYSVTVSNSCGSDMSSVSVLSSQLSAGFIPDTLSGAFPLDVNFQNNSVGANTYTWDFGDGSGSGLSDPSHTFQYNGTFRVTLTATDVNGCTQSTMVIIEVYDDTQITIPNVFTPNGDGKNEFFNLFTNKMNLEIEGQIFNRWGKKIASWDSLSHGWDGKTQNGKNAPEGVYVYIIKIIRANGDAEERHGAVSLIR